MIIYKITNLKNSKCYIGQTVRTLKERWKEHRNEKRSIIGRAIKKYGVKNFKIEEIGGANSITELNYQEWLLIHKNNTMIPNGYNLKEGGLNGFFSEETKNKISKALKNREFSKEHREKLSISARSYWDKVNENCPSIKVRNKIVYTDEIREKLRKSNKKMWIKRKKEGWKNPLKGKKRPDISGKNNPMYGKNPEDYMSPEAIKEKRKKYSLKMKGRKFSKEHKEKIGKAHRKKIKCLDNGKIFNSITEAAKEIGACNSYISQVINGKHTSKTVKGLTFVYV